MDAGDDLGRGWSDVGVWPVTRRYRWRSGPRDELGWRPPSGTVPIAGGSTELSFTGTFTVIWFAAQAKQLTLQGTLNGPLASAVP
jgi:hypothetical protein